MIRKRRWLTARDVYDSGRPKRGWCGTCPRGLLKRQPLITASMWASAHVLQSMSLYPVDLAARHLSLLETNAPTW
jgi:hypothetical protein